MIDPIVYHSNLAMRGTTSGRDARRVARWPWRGRRWAWPFDAERT